MTLEITVYDEIVDYDAENQRREYKEQARRNTLYLEGLPRDESGKITVVELQPDEWKIEEYL